MSLLTINNFSNEWLLYIALILLGMIIISIIILAILIFKGEPKRVSKEAEAVVKTLLPEVDPKTCDLAKITQAIELMQNEPEGYIDFEHEQEAKAIISYHQLINTPPHSEVDLSVKKVTLPESNPTPSHHRESLASLVDNHQELNVQVNPSTVVVAKGFLDDLKTLNNKLR